MASSLGPNDDMQWVFGGVDVGDGETADEIVRQIGALLVGRRTQDVEDRLQPGFYGGAYSGPFFVLRHDPPTDPPSVKGVTGTFATSRIEDAVALAQRRGRQQRRRPRRERRSAVSRGGTSRRDRRARGTGAAWRRRQTV